MCVHASHASRGHGVCFGTLHPTPSKQCVTSSRTKEAEGFFCCFRSLVPHLFLICLACLEVHAWSTYSSLCVGIQDRLYLALCDICRLPWSMSGRWMSLGLCLVCSLPTPHSTPPCPRPHTPSIIGGFPSGTFGHYTLYTHKTNTNLGSVRALFSVFVHKTKPKS